MYDDIPPLLPFDELPAVKTQAELETHWRRLMGKLGFSEPLLWILLFDAEGDCAPLIQQIEETPDLPDEETLTSLMCVCQMVLDNCAPGGSVAFLRSRPGRAGFTRADRAWATGLSRAAREARLNCHPVHLANDQELRVFAPDDEIARVWRQPR